jgi:hypothetical protein
MPPFSMRMAHRVVRWYGCGWTGGKRLKIETVVPTWTRSKERFFERDAFLALIDHYDTLGCGFYGVDVFSADGQLLTVEIAPEHGAIWARSVAQQWRDDGVLFSPTLCSHQKKSCRARKPLIPAAACFGWA